MANDRTGQARRHVGFLISNWKICLLVPFILACGTYVALFFVSKQYRSEAVVTANSIDMASTVMDMAEVPTSSLEWFFKDGQLIDEVIVEFDLESRFSLTRARFLRSALDVQTPRNSRNVIVSVRLGDADLARDVANALARRGVGNYVSQMRQQYDGMIKKLTADSSGAQTELTSAEKDFTKFQSEFEMATLQSRLAVQRRLRESLDTRFEGIALQVSELKSRIQLYELEQKEGTMARDFESTIAKAADIATALAGLNRAEKALAEGGLESAIRRLIDHTEAEYRLDRDRAERLAVLRAQLAAVTSAISKLSEQLAKLPRTLDLKRTLANDPQLQQILAKLSDKGVEELTELGLNVSVLNPAYTSTENALGAARTERSALEGEQAEIIEARKQTAKGLPALKRQLLAARQALRPLSQARQSAMTRYQAADEALWAAASVVKEVHLPIAKLLVEARKSLTTSLVDMLVVESAKESCETKLTALHTEVTQGQRRLRELTFIRDQAQSQAGQLLGALRQIRALPIWPPVQLTVSPANRPEYPVSPRSVRLSVAVLFISFALAWAAVGIIRKPQI